MTTTHFDITLDQQIEQLAQSCDASEAQLKTVYLRGVNDFLESDITYGSATMYGLARVQRFIKERGAILDADLVETELAPPETDCGIELAAGAFFSPDIVYASGQEVARLFKPGEVTAMTLTDNVLHVQGSLGALHWSYELNTTTGQHSFTVLS